VVGYNITHNLTHNYFEIFLIDYHFLEDVLRISDVSKRVHLSISKDEEENDGMNRKKKQNNKKRRRRRKLDSSMSTFHDKVYSKLPLLAEEGQYEKLGNFLSIY